MSKKKISSVVVTRLSIYRRTLARLEWNGTETISSEALGKIVGFGAAQIRKDLSCFGEFGEAGTGYHVILLKDAICHILGIDRVWNTALVGVGRLGSALLAYSAFRASGFKIVAAFENDVTKTGKKWENVVIEDISKLPVVVEEKEIKIAILAVPPEMAQKVADKVVSCGIRAILNFAPARVTVPEGVRLRNVSFSSELEALSYFLTHRTEKKSELNKEAKRIEYEQS